MTDTNIVGPFGAGINPTTARPTDIASGSSLDTWFQPCVGGDPSTGTKIPAVWLNKVTALLRNAIRGMGVTQTELDDDMLLKAIQHADRGLVNVGDAGARVFKAITDDGHYGLRRIKPGGGISIAEDDGDGNIVVAAIPGAQYLGRRIWDAAGTHTYTPTAGVTKIRVTVIGASGPGGYAQATDGSHFGAAGGGGAGGIAVSDITAGFAGTTITVGAKGVSTTSSSTSGGTSSFGAFCSATGGGPGAAANPLTAAQIQTGGAGGTGTGGNVLNGKGASGAPGITFQSLNEVSGFGAPSPLGLAGGNSVYSSSTAGSNSIASGAGGGGAVIQTSSAALKGGDGFDGVVIVDEYI